MRVDGRRTDELRSVTIVPNYTTYAEGSVLIGQFFAIQKPILEVES